MRYIKRLRIRPSIYLIRGQIVHTTLHQFNRTCHETPSEIPPEKVCQALLTLFNQEWQNKENAFRSLRISDEQLDYFHHESELMLLNFGHWLVENHGLHAHLSEARLWSRNLGLMGIIDAVHLVGDKVVLVDYKTSKHPEITEDMKRQAALYALLYQDRYDRVPDEVWIHFLKVPDDPMPIHIDEHTLQYGKILIDGIHEKTSSQDEKDYPCKCGGYCERDFINGQDGLG